MISITGYYDTGGHTTFIAESVKAAAANQERNPRIFVDLPKKTADKDIRHALHHFVRIVGVFQYRELTKKEIPIPPDRDPTARGFVERTMGFGWMGIYDKQITDVREFRVLDNK